MGCKIDGCTHLGALTSKGTRQFPLGYCNTHYRRFKKYGDPHMRKAVVGQGRKDDPLYQTYGRILRRVDNPNSSEYKYYGLLGIKICQGWRGLHGFTNFKNDMGSKPSSKHSIDRINVHGNYSCGRCKECLREGWLFNCRWATASVQAANRRKNNKDVGVSWDKSKRKYRATLSVDNKTVLSKRFETYDEALFARREAEIEYLGYYINENS